MADIVKISDEEIEFITGEKDIDDALTVLFKKGIKLVVYTCGDNGAYAFTQNVKTYSPSVESSVSDTTGAGDGFIGAFLWKLTQYNVEVYNLEGLNEEILKNCLDFANKFAGISVTRQGAINSYPCIEEINI